MLTILLLSNFPSEILVNEPNNAALWDWTVITDSQGTGVSSFLVHLVQIA